MVKSYVGNHILATLSTSRATFTAVPALNTTVGNTVTLAVRALRQDRIGQDLTAALRDDEAAWLDADFG